MKLNFTISNTVFPFQMNEFPEKKKQRKIPLKILTKRMEKKTKRALKFNQNEEKKVNFTE
jgi:hypothetical protein